MPPPNFGYKQHELMQDIATSVGATYFSEKTGDDLSLINYGDLGHAAKVIVSNDKTIILKSNARVKVDVVEERVKQLWMAHAIAKRKADKDFLLERIASLTGGIGVIYVGGNTDLEQKELYDRVDDAVCAVRSALEEGILPGAGKALLTSVDLLKAGDYDSIRGLVDNALKAGGDKNIGLEYDKDIETRYREEHRITIPTPWDMFNNLMQGGLGSGDFGLIFSLSISQ